MSAGYGAAGWREPLRPAVSIGVLLSARLCRVSARDGVTRPRGAARLDVLTLLLNAQVSHLRLVQYSARGVSCQATIRLLRLCRRSLSHAA